MKSFHTHICRVLFLGLLLISVGIQAAPNSLVNFTLSVNNTVDSGLSYTGYVAGDTAAQSRYVIGFQIAINSVDGIPLNLSPVAAFCSEIQEPISTLTYTFTAEPLRNLAAGRAGDAGTASSGIPTNGIGTHRAARLSYLFDQHYTSIALTGWDRQDLHAFQLAVWEVTHDDDLDMRDPLGTNYLATQTGGNDPTFREDSVDLAQSWMDDISGAGITPSYRSDIFDFWALTSTTGNGDFGFQDVILATLKGSQEYETLSELIVIPEPAMLLGCVLAFTAAYVLRPRRR